ncbi:RAVE complex protein Rav1 C-terminal [Penicillium cf. viridicatum]|uniref:RAVE complex protein Rav1 C-terminal n=1 Tax=Penicillium cf. viridicatum TaxID=2972119 RepID=A0A9W9MVA1_9EURO|nr:RAVE complex protein Rav1 C-terminal [Penicillium cf. viridicatum]
MYISDGYNIFLLCPVDRFVPSSFVLFKLMVISHEWSGSVIDQVSLPPCPLRVSRQLPKHTSSTFRSPCNSGYSQT